MEDIDFVPSEPALILKELGFDEPCFGYYVGLGDNKENPFKLVQIKSEKGQFEWIDNVCHAPTFSQAFRFFRKKYELHSFIDCKWKNIGWEYELVDLNKMEKISCIGNYGYKTPEEAELECLKKLIEIVKNGKEHTDS